MSAIESMASSEQNILGKVGSLFRQEMKEMSNKVNDHKIMEANEGLVSLEQKIKKIKNC